MNQTPKPAPRNAPQPSQTLGPTLRRRTLLAGAGAAVAASNLGGSAAADPTAPSKANDQLVRLSEGTNFAVQASPDGRWLALDILGVLWVMPASGGAARRLTSDLFDVTQPSWSPDSERLVFQSYRAGVFDLWTVRRDGGGMRRLTTGPYDHREPRWSPDGSAIVFSSDVNGSYGIYRYDVANETIAVVADTAGVEEYEPCWSPDGTRVGFVAAGTRIEVIELASGARTVISQAQAPTQLRQPAFTPDGRGIVHHRTVPGSATLWLDDVFVSDFVRSRTKSDTQTTVALVDDEEVFPFSVSWLPDGRFAYAAGGGVRLRRPGESASRVGFSLAVPVRRARYTKRRRDFESRRPQPVVGVGSPQLSPNGRQVVFRALNDLYLLDIGGRARPLTGDSTWKAEPAWSPDGRFIAYSGDRGGTLDLWLHDVEAGTDRQLTNLPDRAATAPAWSPDGRELAFLDQDGGLWIADAASGEVQRLFTATFEPGRPTWSPDGNVVALAAVKPYSSRFREGLSQILLVDRRTGRARYVEPIPDRSIQTRGDDGPVWSPDGRHLAFAVASVLWVLPVSADGTPRGAAIRVNDEVSDAPSWSPDSRQLLYLNNGRLRMVPIRRGRPRTITTGLRWANARGADRTIIHAGSMWDGRAEQARAGVDIIIEGQRIVDVLPHSVGRHSAGRSGRLVDASDAFVMPGLVDAHHHREMQGYSYGDRQGRLWLSYGVTTTRSPGSPAYQMVEERESIQSGKRIGPRYFATGEAIDGARIYYNFMRPTFSSAQVRLELERAVALDYDLVKNYVRLPVEQQRRITAFAQRRGIAATGHYHYPAVTFGGDQMEHGGATSRFGFSRTVTSQGNGYDDVVELFNAAGMARTPTLFISSNLYSEDRSLVDDRRTRVLYPPWRLAALDQTVRNASGPAREANLANLSRQVGQLLAMVRGGGLVVTGTDAPIDHVAISTHMNLRAMVRYGFSPVQALRTATSNAGTLLGEPLGRIARGCYADLVAVRGNPLRNIVDAAAVQRVWCGGVEYDVDGLLAPYGRVEPQSGARRQPSVVKPPIPAPASNDVYWWHDPDYLAAAREACCG